MYFYFFINHSLLLFFLKNRSNDSIQPTELLTKTSRLQQRALRGREDIHHYQRWIKVLKTQIHSKSLNGNSLIFVAGRLIISFITFFIDSFIQIINILILFIYLVMLQC